MTKRSRKDIEALIDAEVEAIEAERNAPVEESRVTRGNGRSKTLQVRLNPEELEELERLAATRGLPTSTLAREAILRLIRPEATRSAAASRVVEEFAHFIDTFNVRGDALLPYAKLFAASDPPAALQREQSAALQRLFEERDLPPDSFRVVTVDPSSLHEVSPGGYALSRDESGKYRIFIVARTPGGDLVKTSRMFESEADAETAIDLLKCLQKVDAG